ncbi:MAG TPA: hypothetical protein VLB46_12820 [Pyrinomonadaceae bacterium]|nr:hypothetical protein [Pyrinomonadaceae bacterium]
MFIPGGTWNGAANGMDGKLEINFGVGDSFSGNAFGRSMRGTVQLASGEISFVTDDGSRNYKGSISPQTDRAEPAVYVLAGSYADSSGTYGWFAQQWIVP